MPDLIHWTTFFSATIILLLIPGPSVMYVMARGLEHGYRGAVFSSLGLALADLLQVLCTALGISALLASSNAAFSMVKYAGAAYLIGLGAYRMFTRNVTVGTEGVISEPPSQAAPRRLVMQGFLALNPKTAIFFLALFPQFVSQDAGPAWLQILFFGIAFVMLGFVTNSIYGCLGGGLSTLATRDQRFKTATRYISGIVLLGMGVGAAVASAPHRV